MESSPVDRSPNPLSNSQERTPEEGAQSGSGRTEESRDTSPRSAWLEYLAGRRKAKSFLARLMKTKIPVPDRRTIDAFARMVTEKPSRLSKVLDLLQTSKESGGTIRGIVADLAIAVSAAFELRLPDDKDGAAFLHSAEEWISRSDRRPLKKAHLEVLLIAINAAVIRTDLDAESAFRLVRLAVVRPAGSRRRKDERRPPKDFVDVLLSATPAASVLETLVDSHAVHRAETDEASHTIADLQRRITELNSALTGAVEREEELTNRIASLEQQVADGKERCLSLEHELVTLEDGYKHKLSDLRGRLGGMLDGQLKRWLETALDASRSDPPWIEAVTERLEDALALIDKEKRWLQPSA